MKSGDFALPGHEERIRLVRNNKVALKHLARIERHSRNGPWTLPVSKVHYRSSRGGAGADHIRMRNALYDSNCVNDSLMLSFLGGEYSTLSLDD